MTERASSPLREELERLGGSVEFWEKSRLPGRFLLFHLAGLLQAHLSGVNIELFSRGFQEGKRDLHKMAASLSLFGQNRPLWLIADPPFRGASFWMESAFSESLAKAGCAARRTAEARHFQPLRAASFSSMTHSFLEEAVAPASFLFVRASQAGFPESLRVY